jgi:rubrerythrin
LFQAAAEAERIHAEGHLKALEGIGSTAENLQGAIDGETYEYTEMYPPMFDQAQTDQHKAKRMFEYAMKAEEVHAKLYKLALEAVQQGKDLDTDFYLCPVCGYIEFGKPTGECPVCGTKAEKFIPF